MAESNAATRRRESGDPLKRLTFTYQRWLAGWRKFGGASDADAARHMRYELRRLRTQSFLHEEGDNEDYGPPSPETVEALKEHGIELPTWKPVVPPRALVAEWRRTRAFDILTINAKTGTWRRPWWLFRTLRLYVLRWIG